MKSTAVLCILIFIYIQTAATVQLQNPSVIPGFADYCPSTIQTQSLREELARNISTITNEWIRTHCGTATGWTRIAYLNMTDPNQQCPANWREYSLYNQRLCGSNVCSFKVTGDAMEISIVQWACLTPIYVEE